jgi:hypothetical protein
MAIESTVTAREMGRALAEAARDEPRIVEIWGADRPDAVQLWVITTPITMVEMRALSLLEDVLLERFPDTPHDVLLLNPRHHPKGARRAVPGDAERIAP